VAVVNLCVDCLYAWIDPRIAMPADPPPSRPRDRGPRDRLRGWRLPIFPVGVIGLFLLLALVAPL